MGSVIPPLPSSLAPPLLTILSLFHSHADLAGQPRFRSIWERYCRGVNAIVWVLDSDDRETFPVARTELASLLEKPELAGIPLLVRYTSLLRRNEELDEC
jgi:hypothetical protein